MSDSVDRHEAIWSRLGAVTGSAPAGDVALHYGDPAAEYQALKHGCALLVRAEAQALVVAGEDRQRFLNGLITANVKDLAPRAGCYGFFTSAQGRVLADGLVLAGDDHLQVEVGGHRRDAMLEHLAKYVIVDRVELSPVTELLPLTLVGRGVAAALARLAGAELPETAFEHRPCAFFGQPAEIVARELWGLPAWDLWVARDGVAGLVPELLRAVAGLVLAGEQASETVRVEAGRARFGADFGLDHFPQETGLDEVAVSYTKGCYLGQEIVARIHYRGQVNRVLRGLLLDGPGLPPTGSAILYEGKEWGRLGSAVQSPALERPLGLAVLHHRAAAPGTRVELETGGGAQVVELPFRPS